MFALSGTTIASRSRTDRVFVLWIFYVIVVVASGSLIIKNKPKKSSIEASNDGKPQDDVTVVINDDDFFFAPYTGERFDRFDWRLLKSLMRKNDRDVGENLLVSPISLKLALVLLYVGATGETAKELAEALGFSINNKNATNNKYQNVIKSLQEKKSTDYTLNFGTRIFLDQGITPRQSFASTIATFYSTEIIKTNFSDVKVTADLINRYVDEITEGRIAKLINEDPGLREKLMIIVNAMFFKGHWHRHLFDPIDTKIGNFHASDGRIVQVSYMRTVKKLHLAESSDLDAKILRLPYAGKKYSMYIVLPEKKNNNNLYDLVSKINLRWKFQETLVNVQLPKFKFDSTNHLENNLRELGINSIFDESATLTGILRMRTTPRRLVVSDIVQKTGIEINEHGSTIYSATEIEIVNKINTETIFNASRPFLFYIEDEKTGTILYTGVMNDPSDQNETKNKETSMTKLNDGI